MPSDVRYQPPIKAQAGSQGKKFAVIEGVNGGMSLFSGCRCDSPGPGGGYLGGIAEGSVMITHVQRHPGRGSLSMSKSPRSRDEGIDNKAMSWENSALSGESQGTSTLGELRG